MYRKIVRKNISKNEERERKGGGAVEAAKSVVRSLVSCAGG